MFIAIDAKADVAGSKKGRLTPAQHAQLNAWCLASKTGILDCLDRCEATENSFTAINNTAEITFKKGYLVICGRLVECESNTKFTMNTPASGSVSGKIVLKYDLSAIGEKEFEIIAKTGALVQQDLNENPVTGVYEFELYSYTATPTSVTLIRTEEYIPDIGGKLSQFEASLTDAGKPLGGYDTSKGTIEERLTRLGFKNGAINFLGEDYSSETNTGGNANGVFRQGNYVVGNLHSLSKYINSSIYENYFQLNDVMFILPEGFRPKTDVYCSIIFIVGSNGIIGKDYFESKKIRIQPDGKAIVTRTVQTNGGVLNQTPIIDLSFGFEAEPID